MCQRQAALRHHLYQVAQAQFRPKTPAHAQNDDLAVEMSTREQLVQGLQLVPFLRITRTVERGNATRTITGWRPL
jgi:hypothetical protein